VRVIDQIRVRRHTFVVWCTNTLPTPPTIPGTRRRQHPGRTPRVFWCLYTESPSLLHTHTLFYRQWTVPCSSFITPRMNTFKHRAIRYFWDPEPRNEDPSQMIWCLGKQYAPPSPPPQHQQYRQQQHVDTDKPMIPENSIADAATTWPPHFLDDFETRIWMTYRTDFPPIPRSPSVKGLPFNSAATALQYAGSLIRGQPADGFSSDVGWGCMIRSAQSLFANALITLHLGRGTLCISCIMIY